MGGKKLACGETVMRIRCLLIVDDDREDLADTERKLAGTHLDVGEVVVATSLAQAIREIVSRDIDIVLLDLDLGDSKSLDTLAAVRAVTDAVVIVLSVCGDEVLAVESLRYGADEFLVKARMTEGCLREAILKSITRRQIRRTACRIDTKLAQLTKLAGVG
jgi:DNA-binding response OmpR family regulator